MTKKKRDFELGYTVNLKFTKLPLPLIIFDAYNFLIAARFFLTVRSLCVRSTSNNNNVLGTHTHTHTVRAGPPPFCLIRGALNRPDMYSG